MNQYKVLAIQQRDTRAIQEISPTDTRKKYPVSLQEDTALRIYTQKTLVDTPIDPRDPHKQTGMDIAVTYTWPPAIAASLFGGLDFDRFETAATKVIRQKPSLHSQFLIEGDQFCKVQGRFGDLRLERGTTPHGRSINFCLNGMRILRVETNQSPDGTQGLKFCMSHLYADAQAGFALLGDIAKEYAKSTLLIPFSAAFMTVVFPPNKLSVSSFNNGLFFMLSKLSIASPRIISERDEYLSLGKTQQDILANPKFLNQMSDLKENYLSRTSPLEFSINPELTLPPVTKRMVSKADLEACAEAAGSNKVAVLNFLAAVTAWASNHERPVIFRSPRSARDSHGDTTYRATALLGDGNVTAESTLNSYTKASKKFRTDQTNPENLQNLIPAERQLQLINRKLPDTDGRPFSCEAEVNIFPAAFTGKTPFTMGHYLTRFDSKISLGEWSDPELYDPKLAFVLQENKTAYSLEIGAHATLPEGAREHSEALFMALFNQLKQNPAATARELIEGLKR